MSECQERIIQPRYNFPFPIKVDYLLLQPFYTLRRNWFGKQRSRHSRNIFPMAPAEEVEVTGSETFATSDDLTLSNTTVVNGYLRRSYSHYYHWYYGGSDLKIKPTDSVFKARWQNASWGEIVSRYGFLAGSSDGYGCGDVYNDAKTSRRCRMYSGYFVVNDLTWYYFNQTIDSTPNCNLSPSVYYRICHCGKSNSVEYRYNDGTSHSNVKYKAYDCPANPSDSSARMYKMRIYLADFGTDTRYAEKKTSETAPATITKATLTVTTLSDLGGSGGSNNYYVSRDGGTTWVEVTSGVEHEFDGAEADKKNFKFKIVAGQYNRGSTKRIDQIDWSYKYMD